MSSRQALEPPRRAKQLIIGGKNSKRRRAQGRSPARGIFDNMMALGMPLFVMVVVFAISAGARQVQTRGGSFAARGLMNEGGERNSWPSPLEMPGQEAGSDSLDSVLLNDRRSSIDGDGGRILGPLANDTVPVVGPTTIPASKLREEECEMPYGVLPCSTNVVGNVFLMWAFGSILITAAKFISEGSELLLEVVNPGLIGGLLLPTLGALPDALLIMVSGLGGSKEEAQEEVVVGIGVLAGSTIMMLSLAWAGAVICGRCDLTGPKGEAVDGKLTLGWSLTETGVTCDDDTRIGAGVMILTILPYIIIQIPLIDKHKKEGPTAALIGLILSWIGLFLYSIYQVANPILQKKKIQEARIDLVHHELMRDLTAAMHTVGGLLHSDGKANQEAIERLFDKADIDGNGNLNASEVRAMLVGLAPEVTDVGSRANSILQVMDLDSDKCITKEEFVPSLSAFLEKKRKVDRENLIQMHQPEFWEVETERQRNAYTELVEMVEEEIEEVEKEGKNMSPAQVYIWAVLYMLTGAVLAAIFADPVVSSISGFSKSSGIPAFFVAFVVTPLGSNSSELVSSLIFAMKKKKRSMSLTLSQVYGAISMNNTLCLGIFLTVVYGRGLTWEFSSESLVIMLAIFIMGSLGYSRKTFPLWMAAPVLAVYPLTLAIVYVCDTFLGWK